jgi:hypothetical protein
MFSIYVYYKLVKRNLLPKTVILLEISLEWYLNHNECKGNE